MNDIIREIEKISETMIDIEKKYNLKENDSMNLLWWKWHEERRGLIKACAFLGVTVEVADETGTKWQAKVIH